jgi:molecular chaperone DnaK (HSP70)
MFGGKEFAKGVNPDEAVCHGAAIQAAVLSGAMSKKKVSLYDVAPLSVGIKTAGGTMSNMISRNTPIPTKKDKVFSTFKDNQEMVKIEVYEGERALVKHNHFLGKFQLEDIPRGKRGSHKFRVTFGISDDGMLTVSAFHVGYGSNEFNLTIDGDSGRLTEEEMKAMLIAAEEHKDQDKELRLSLAAKASLDSYCFQLKNYVTDDKLMIASEDEKDEDDQPIMIPIAALEDIQDSLDALLEIIEETAAYVAANPFESVETYGARRTELQAAADPVVEHLRHGALPSLADPP